MFCKIFQDILYCNDVWWCIALYRGWFSLSDLLNISKQKLSCILFLIRFNFKMIFLFRVEIIKKIYFFGSEFRVQVFFFKYIIWLLYVSLAFHSFSLLFTSIYCIIYPTHIILIIFLIMYYMFSFQFRFFFTQTCKN